MSRWVVENSSRIQCGESDARLSMTVYLSWNGETEGRAESEI